MFTVFKDEAKRHPTIPLANMRKSWGGGGGGGGGGGWGEREEELLEAKMSRKTHFPNIKFGFFLRLRSYF